MQHSHTAFTYLCGKQWVLFVTYNLFHKDNCRFKPVRTRIYSEMGRSVHKQNAGLEWSFICKVSTKSWDINVMMQLFKLCWCSRVGLVQSLNSLVNVVYTIGTSSCVNIIYCLEQHFFQTYHSPNGNPRDLAPCWYVKCLSSYPAKVSSWFNSLSKLAMLVVPNQPISTVIGHINVKKWMSNCS